MTLQQLRESNWIIYECIAGSHAYGTNKEGSDIDIRGVYIQPTTQILANGYIPQISDDSNDTTFYEIGRFIELATNANPNILDLLAIPQDCLIYKSPLWDKYFPNPYIFITTKIKHTFLGYAYSQIQKAKGLDKKQNWEKERTIRKDILDFCYILGDKEESIPFKKYFEISDDIQYPLRYWGLASINNFPNCYSMYYFPNGDGGICNENSNDLQICSIPKEYNKRETLYFNKDSYSIHCKEYKEYKEWLEKRNPLRYADNAKVNNNYDTKNLLHCLRLLLTVKDIAKGKGLIIRRPEKKYLLSIRNGELSYNKILNRASKLMKEIDTLFETSTLPKEVDKEVINKLLLSIRIDNLFSDLKDLIDNE